MYTIEKDNRIIEMEDEYGIGNATGYGNRY